MLEKVFNLFGCRHTRLSVPFSMETARQNQAHLDWSEELPTGCSHYVVCLDCGRRFGYDWSEMRVVRDEDEGRGVGPAGRSYWARIASPVNGFNPQG